MLLSIKDIEAVNEYLTEDNLKKIDESLVRANIISINRSLTITGFYNSTPYVIEYKMYDDRFEFQIPAISDYTFTRELQSREQFFPVVEHIVNGIRKYIEEGKIF